MPLCRPPPRRMSADDRRSRRQMGFCCVPRSRIIQSESNRVSGDRAMSLHSTPNASSLTASERERVLNILQSNWQAEMHGCHTYELWAERETEPQRRIAFRTLAKAEKHHADLWAERIRVLGGSEPIYHGPGSGEADTIANRVGGLGLALRRLELDESRDIAKYAKQLEPLGDEPSIVILKQVLEDERHH